MSLVYGSVCSGIEAASVAWHPLGWRPAFFSEIEPFPRAVLQQRWPDVPLHGDFTTIQAGEYADIDVLVGGTPCQSFSIAGLRKGMADERGNLALEFLRLAQRLRPRWLVWENVPGVLSSDGGRDFGSILGGLAELGYGFAYRVLDAQYIRVDGYARAVPQRRRRVFVVGHLGDWRRAAAVLFERESLSGHPAPRREAGKVFAAGVGSGPADGGGGADADTRPATWIEAAEQTGGAAVAPTIPSRSSAGGDLGTDFDCDGGLVAGTLSSSGAGTARTGNARSEADMLIPAVCGALSDGAHMGGGLTGRTHIQEGSSLPSVAKALTAGVMRLDSETDTLLPLQGGAFGVVTARETGQGFWTDDGTAGLRANPGGMPENLVAHALRADGFDASEDGTGRGTPIVTVAFSHQHAGRAGEPAPSHATGTTVPDGGASEVANASTAQSGPRPAISLAIAIQERAVCENPNAGPDGAGLNASGSAYTLEARSKVQAAVAFDTQQITSKANRTRVGPDLPASTLAKQSRMHVATTMAVRRLTPMECERLQGFPDGFTRIVTRRSRKMPPLAKLVKYPDLYEKRGDIWITYAADGPRYKALGNSMACNVMRWIGRRIQAVESIIASERAA